MHHLLRFTTLSSWKIIIWQNSLNLGDFAIFCKIFCQFTKIADFSTYLLLNLRLDARRGAVLLCKYDTKTKQNNSAFGAVQICKSCRIWQMLQNAYTHVFTRVSYEARWNMYRLKPYKCIINRSPYHEYHHVTTCVSWCAFIYICMYVWAPLYTPGLYILQRFTNGIRVYVLIKPFSTGGVVYKEAYPYCYVSMFMYISLYLYIYIYIYKPCFTKNHTSVIMSDRIL